MTDTNTGKGYSTEIAVSSLLQTATDCHENAGRSEELMSDSERTNAGEDKRRCVCHMGDACRIMSTAFAVTNDPRGYHVQIPTNDYHLRKAYCRYLCPHDEVPSSKQPGDDFTMMNVAVHHFHPKVIATYFNTKIEDREEDGDILPLPTRVMTIKERKSFGLHLDDHDRVIDPSTGRPSQPRLYHIVPSYSFDMAHSNLKESMTFMQQVELDKCVRRMRREARRQKWETLANSWQKTSERNLNTLKKFSTATNATDTLLGKAPASLTTPKAADSLLGTKVPLKNDPPANAVAVMRQTAMDIPSVLFPRETTVPPPPPPPPPAPSNTTGVLSENAKDLLRSSSTLTAQELLESEMEDDDSVPDLNSLEGSIPTNTDDSEEDSTKKSVETISTNASKEVEEGTSSSLSGDGTNQTKVAIESKEELVSNLSAAESNRADSMSGATATKTSTNKSLTPILPKKEKEKPVPEIAVAKSNKKVQHKNEAAPSKIPTLNASKKQKAGQEKLITEIPASVFNGGAKKSPKGGAQNTVKKVDMVPTKTPTLLLSKEQTGEENVSTNIPASVFNDGAKKASKGGAQNTVTKVDINKRAPVPKPMYKKQMGSVMSNAPVVSIKKPKDKVAPKPAEKDLASTNVVVSAEPTNRASQKAATNDASSVLVADRMEKDESKIIDAASETEAGISGKDIHEMKAGPPSYTLRNTLIGIYLGALTVTGVYVYQCTQLLASREDGLA